MKTFWKNSILDLLIILAPLVFVLVHFQSFPAQMPIHINIKGDVDDYAGKMTGLFLLPLINFGLFLLFTALPYIDPWKKNYMLFSTSFKVIRSLCHIFLSGICFLFYFIALKFPIDVARLTNLGLILFCLIVGNYLSKVRPNFFVGVRTPWTLASEEVWVKTHRFSGKLWVASSLLMLILVMAGLFNQVMFYIYLGLIAGVPIVYSLVLFKRIEKKKEE